MVVRLRGSLRVSGTCFFPVFVPFCYDTDSGPLIESHVSIWCFGECDGLCLLTGFASGVQHDS